MFVRAKNEEAAANIVQYNVVSRSLLEFRIHRQRIEGSVGPQKQGASAARRRPPSGVCAPYSTSPWAPTSMNYSPIIVAAFNARDTNMSSRCHYLGLFIL